MVVAAPTITLRAFASGYGSSAAQLQLRSNGIIVATFEVRATTAFDHALPLSTVLQAGTLELVLLNADAQAGRALVVQSLSHNGATLTPTDNDVVFDQGSGPAAFDGLDTVPGTRTLTTAGALRFSLPVSRVVAAAAIDVPDASTAAPGVYVDADRGDDANAGTFDRPWRSLAWPRCGWPPARASTFAAAACGARRSCSAPNICPATTWWPATAPSAARRKRRCPAPMTSRAAGA